MLTRRILLTILPVFWPKLPPLGLGYLQSFLENKGINNLELLDFNNFFYRLADADLKRQWLVSCNLPLEKNILSRIKNNFPHEYQQMLARMLSYDMIGFSCFKSNFPTALKVAKLLKSKKKEIKIIFGGPEMTRQFFKGKGKFRSEITRLADFLVVGEGEKPLYDYLGSDRKGAKIVKFDQLGNLEEIPFPKYAGLDLKSYPQEYALPLQFSRGCIRSCNFCAERLLYRGLRTRSVAKVIEEIRFHKENNQVKYFVFFDSLINANLQKLEDLCDQIIDKFGSINWEAQLAIRSDMPPELFTKMKKSGCYNLFIGLESGSDVTLKKMNKGFNTHTAASFFQQLNRAGLNFGISMIVGYPGESEAEFKESLAFIIRNKKVIPKIEQVNPFTYYDGINTDRRADYKINPNSLERMKIFVQEIKKHHFKYTNAFLGNLIEKC